MACKDERIQPLLLKLLGCIDRTFEECGIETCYIGPQAGALTDLTPMGTSGSMAWVRLVTVAPLPTANPVQCYTRLGAQIEIGFATCYTIAEDGSPRTQDEDIAIMVEVTNAQSALLNAILCCDWYPRPKDIEVLSWSPAGPDAGAVGGAWAVNVEV